MPHDETNKALFWKFRMNEMWSQYKVWSILLVVGFISALISVLTDPTPNNKYDLYSMTFVIIC